MLVSLPSLVRNDDSVKKISFKVSSKEDIQHCSVVDVHEIPLYNRGIPSHHGVNSLFLGSTDRRLRCLTCKKTLQDCQGHSGSITLPLPVFQALFIDTTLKILRSTCFFCSNLCLTDEEKESAIKIKDPKIRFNFVYSCAKTKKLCSSCGGPRPTYTRTSFGISTAWNEENDCDIENSIFESENEKKFATQKFTPSRALSILEGVRDGKLFFGSGFEPKDLIATTINVPSSSIRPSSSSVDSSRTRGHDDISIRLQEVNKRCVELKLAIIKALEDSSSIPVDLTSLSSKYELLDIVKKSSFNHYENVVESIASSNDDVFDRWARLQLDVFSFVNPGAIRGGSSNAAAVTGTAPSIGVRGIAAGQGKSLISRLKGKEGRFRSNLMGKRVNFSSRSVITPDPTIDVDEVGVPYELAKVLTVAETVTPSNIIKLRKLILNGPDAIEGAQSIVTDEGKLFLLSSTMERSSIVVRFGWRVERHLRDGDYVILNRQPTLHRLGFNGQRVRLMPGKTFRLNLSMCGVYNADFDGDEMNVHVVQSACATAEVSTIMAVERNLISSQSNKPSFGIVQDSLVGAWLMSKPGVLFREKEANRLLVQIKLFTAQPFTLPAPAVLVPERLWTGTQIFSTILPSTMKIGRFVKQDDIEDCFKKSLDSKDVLIVEGQLLYGRLSKKSLGATAGSITDVIHRLYGGSKKAIQFLSNVQRLCNAWLFLHRSFSIGAKDCFVSDEAEEKVSGSIKEATKKVGAICEASIPDSLFDLAEAAKTSILNDLIMTTSAILKKEAVDNSIVACVDSGSKGSPLNISQVCGQVGQQIVCGKRVVIAPEGSSASILENLSRRTLPCYKISTASPSSETNSHGFIQNSFTLGLEPTEFFFSAMSGREGLVDTAVKTASSGYLQRCLVKSLEDSQYCYDTTIRNAQQNIIQFCYADNYDPCRLQLVSTRQLLEFDPSCSLNKFTLRESAHLQHLRSAALSKLAPFPNKAFSEKVLLPIDVKQVIDSGLFSKSDTAADCFDTDCIFDMVCDAVDEMKKQHAIQSTLEFFIHVNIVQSVVVSKRVDVGRLIEYVKETILSSALAGGDAVGNTAALSLGEPSTQLTLNSFHTAGTSHTSVTMGVPRLKEIISCAKTIRTPQTVLEFADKDGPKLASIASKLTKRSIGDVVLTNKVSLTETIEACLDEENKLLLAMDLHMFPPLEETKEVDPCKNCILFELNDQMLRDLSLSPKNVKDAIFQCLSTIMMTKNCISPSCTTTTTTTTTSDDVRVFASEYNASKWIVLVRFSKRAVEGMLPLKVSNYVSIERAVLRSVSISIMEGKLCGVTGVVAANVDTVKRWNPDIESNEETKVISTRGSFLGKAGCIDGVVWEKSKTNDILAVEKLLGIEAATTLIFEEVYTILTSDGKHIDPRHVELTTSAMTRNGYVMSLNRHGLNSLSTGPLTKAAFEETSDCLRDAALFGESEDVKHSITSSVMLGQLASFGTGRFNIKRPGPAGGGAGGCGGSASLKARSGGSAIVKTRAAVSTSCLPETETSYLNRDCFSFVHRTPWVCPD